MTASLTMGPRPSAASMVMAQTTCSSVQHSFAADLTFPSLVTFVRLVGAIRDLQSHVPSNHAAIKKYTAFRETMVNAVSDQKMVLKAKLNVAKSQRADRLDLLKANHESLKTPKYANDAVLAKSMKLTLRRSLEETEAEYEASRVEVEKLRWSMSSSCFSEMRRFYDLQQAQQDAEQRIAAVEPSGEILEEYSISFGSASALSKKATNRCVVRSYFTIISSLSTNRSFSVEENIEESFSRYADSFVSSVKTVSPDVILTRNGHNLTRILTRR
jgi:hypothetical protein